MALGRTHWNVVPHVRSQAVDIAGRFGASWNSYELHGLPPAKGERYTVDFWGPGGRGAPLREDTGDAICSWILGQHQIRPLRIVIWWSWIWLPNVGWKPYSGFQGNHGPGPDAHIHVGYN
jgi:hypothetical protein